VLAGRAGGRAGGWVGEWAGGRLFARVCQMPACLSLCPLTLSLSSLSLSLSLARSRARSLSLYLFLSHTDGVASGGQGRCDGASCAAYLCEEE
jgi:hypothetical protein